MEKSIGQEILERFQASGMKKEAFAEKIGIHRNNLKALFGYTSIDTARLMLICKALHFDFFSLLSERYRTDSDLSVLKEPEPMSYGKPKGGGILRVVIEMSDDEESRRRALDIAKNLEGTSGVSTSQTKE